MRFTAALLVASSSLSTGFSPVARGGRPSWQATNGALHMANPTKSVFLTAETAKACAEVAGGNSFVRVQSRET